MKKTSCFLAVTFLCSLTLAVAQTVEPESRTTTAASENRLEVETLEKDGPASRGIRPARAFQRRVPAGFRPVIDNTQREEIYRIQQEYFEQIAVLEQRVELLKRERDAKIQAVLTPSQQERVRRTLGGRTTVQ